MGGRVDRRASNLRARRTWEATAVGESRATAAKGTREYFDELRAYRYGYETPFIPRLFDFASLRGKRVLEVGVGNGIDAVEMARHGALYTGLDVTANHIELTRRNFALNLPDYAPRLILGDLLEVELAERFDVVYSFGTLHHIAHEEEYLGKLATLLAEGGVLRIGVYSRYSLFHAYLILTWLAGPRRRAPLDAWRSHLAERSPLDEPVVIKIRSRRQVARLVERCGLRIERYWKRGFVQRYLPLVGGLCKPDGALLNGLGALLGWYHLLECRRSAPAA